MVRCRPNLTTNQACSSRERTPLWQALFLGWLQNSSRFLLLSLQLLHTTAAPWRDRGTALLVPHLSYSSWLQLGCTLATARLHLSYSSAAPRQAPPSSR